MPRHIMKTLFVFPNTRSLYLPQRCATLKKHYGKKRTDHPKSENVKVETEIK